ncbi:MAG: hypothetical protein QMD12_02060 [Candidatus Aenigmarchaeota archaeon]|nr:hypothetical protein [Candidatus Aenigmarchaeota archaeon]
MGVTKVKCPKCGKQILKRVLKTTHGRCDKCGFLLSSSLAIFSSARSRIKSKYGR